MTHRPGTVAPAVALLAVLTLALSACTAASPAASEATSTPEPSPTPTASPEADSPEPGSPGAGESVEVLLADSQFDPDVLTINAGTEVVFVNGDTYDHTVTEGSDGRAVADPFVDEDLGQEPVTVMFDEPGTFQLTCRLHPTMNMTVTVEG